MTGDAAAGRARALPRIDTTVPHSARIWSYWLGGKDTYEVDRIAGERYRRTYPAVVDVARATRGFLTRAVRHVAADAGVRQFLDIGTGLPTDDNTHEVAQRVDPDARVVYVDNDPLVLAHAQALLVGRAPSTVGYVEADVHQPARILETAAEFLDFTRPVGMILNGVLGHVGTAAEARSIVARLTRALSPGSHVVVSDGTRTAEAFERAQRDYNATGAVPYHLRTPGEISGYLDGLELIEPGVVSCPLWRPDAAACTSPQPVAAVGGVGRKPVTRRTERSVAGRRA